MELSKEFDAIIDALPDDWSDLVFEIEIDDFDQYVDAAVIMTRCNGQPHTNGEWQWRVRVSRDVGHAADVETVRSVLEGMDSLEGDGKIRLIDTREGRSEPFNGWGRTESVRQEFLLKRSI